jgi:hypothetical protein
MNADCCHRLNTIEGHLKLQEGVNMRMPPTILSGDQLGSPIELNAA